jgi:hypothetical protein
VRAGTATGKVRDRVEWYRRRATRRKLLLLECAIIRQVPFADCGRTLWELMAEQGWFVSLSPPAEWLRIQKATGGEGPEMQQADRSWRFFFMTGHDAIRWLEQHADDADPDLLLVAENYFHRAEWSAEAGRFDTPDERRDEMEISYGVASWLYGLRDVGLKLWNVLDYYLAHDPAAFYVWAKWRPLHPGHRSAAIRLIEDILWHPIRSIRFDDAWRTPETRAIAQTMFDSRDFRQMPELADALERAGCDNPDILAHGREPGAMHARGCWVVDRVLEKS